VIPEQQQRTRQQFGDLACARPDARGQSALERVLVAVIEDLVV
jgi:hypothetical protein